MAVRDRGLAISLRAGFRLSLLGALVGAAGISHGQERLPLQVAGTWKITRVLPVRAGSACWGDKEVLPLVGSTLEYSQRAMRWHGGAVPLTGITTRPVGSAELAEESAAALKLKDLGINAREVTEVNMQHEDADVTGATTEVPGDSVLLAGPGRIVVSACGVYLEARRVAPRQQTVSTASTAGGSGHKGL